MLLSGLQKKGILSFGKGIPNIREIQTQLVDLRLFGPEVIGSQTWLDPILSSSILRGIYHLRTIAETYKYQEPLGELVQRIKNHLEKYRLPIMIDDTMKAYVIAGYWQDGDQVWLLRFDSHEYRPTTFQDYVSGVDATGYGVQWLLVEEIFEDLFNTRTWLVNFPFPEFEQDMESAPRHN
eukprot:TRINITY_DN2562_c0_g1_i1.p1 TRINITY_DN2562_c0_g1~~TRINITY_DN2562_c0_g1_i1.p1  ORF type:complete len:180 (+),score=23.16 TRINITY_DN2562_c0_g1_i1:220-759(+)